MISFGPIIKEVAESKGLTQAALGVKMNLHEKTISHIYQRTTVSSGLIEQFSEVLVHDFSVYFRLSAPIAALQQKDRDRCDAQRISLQERLDQLESVVARLEESVRDKNRIIQLLEKR